MEGSEEDGTIECIPEPASDENASQGELRTYITISEVTGIQNDATRTEDLIKEQKKLWDKRGAGAEECSHPCSHRGHQGPASD